MGKFKVILIHVLLSSSLCHLNFNLTFLFSLYLVKFFHGKFNEQSNQTIEY
jgi:hypothetical protein